MPTHTRRTRRRSRITPGQRCLIVIAAVLLSAVLLTGVYRSIVRPPERAEEQDPSSSQQDADISDSEALARQAELEALAAHTERKEDFYTIMISGVDDGNGGSDTNILVAVDTGGGAIYGVSIARDTKIEIDGKAHKFNFAYNHGGMEQVAATVSEQLGIPVDYTVEVSLKAFTALVDAVGGVDFYVPVDMDYEDPYQDLSIHYQKGMQHLSGAQALEVVRFREGYVSQDIGRMHTQQDFLKALAKQVLQPGNITKVSTFAKIFQQYVKTDLEVGNLVWFGQEAFSIGAENIAFSTLPGEWKSPYIYLDAEEVLALVNEHLNPYVEPRVMEDLHILGRD